MFRVSREVVVAKHMAGITPKCIHRHVPHRWLLQGSSLAYLSLSPTRPCSRKATKPSANQRIKQSPACVSFLCLVLRVYLPSPLSTHRRSISRVCSQVAPKAQLTQSPAGLRSPTGRGRSCAPCKNVPPPVFFRLSLLSNKKSQPGRAERGEREESRNWKLACCCCCCCCLSAVLTLNHSRHRGGRTQKTPAVRYVTSTTLTARNGGDELGTSRPKDSFFFLEKSRAP